jgi:hypothetical protein
VIQIYPLMLFDFIHSFEGFLSGSYSDFKA